MPDLSSLTVVLHPQVSSPSRLVLIYEGRAYGARSEGRSGAFFALNGRSVGSGCCACVGQGRASEGLAGDITVTTRPDVGAETGQRHIAFLLNLWGAFTAGHPFNYISQTPISTS
ncbi:hypothetical protein C8R44DRAFT_746811 [Mycena epipterygia]|nr:hypothetical protein C8R44DRAFT_746811 [Mycena epipterygia]